MLLVISLLALYVLRLSFRTWMGSGAMARRASSSLAGAPMLFGVLSSMVLCVPRLFYWIWTDSGAWMQRACSSFEGFTLVGVDCLRGGPLMSLARVARRELAVACLTDYLPPGGQSRGHASWFPVCERANDGLRTASSSRRSTSPPRAFSISPRLVRTATSLSPSPDARRMALLAIARLRGGGSPEEEGVPRHESTLGRQLALAPEPLVPDHAAKDSANAAPHASSHTLRPHGYMSAVGESSGAASRPIIDHEVQSSDRSAARFARSWKRSAEAKACFDSFVWPLRTHHELRRLLASDVLTPTWLLLGEFSGAFASVCETERGVVTLSVDLREPEQEGLHFCGSFHDVIELATWDFIVAWPNCTHTAYSNGALRVTKALDGRAFWGHVGVLYVLLAGRAAGRMVEQPDSDFGQLYPTRRVRAHTSQYGDVHSKTINLYLIGASLPGLTPMPGALHERDQLRRPAHWEFPDADARDRFRSSWEHFPLFMSALVGCLCVGEPAPPPTPFEDGLEALACAWHDRGWPVPEGYEACTDGLPPIRARDYQALRGPGDGRRPQAAIPRSRQAGLRPLAGTPTPSADVTPTETPADELIPGDLSMLQRLAEMQIVTLAELTARGVVLIFIATLMQPLVFAHVNGFQVLGAELPLSAARSVPMRLLERWAELAFSAPAVATTFMIGRYGADGPRLGVCLLPFVPPPADVVRSASERRARLLKGATFLWCTLACLTGTPLADPVARALAGLAAFAGPVTYTADALHEGELLHPVFRLGAAPVASMMGMRPVTYDRHSLGHWLCQDADHQRLLRRALEATDDPLLDGWAERILPPPQELLDLVQAQMPDMLSADLLSIPYSPLYVPPTTAYLPRMPAQLPADPPSCVRSAMELLTEHGRQRVHEWLSRVLDQLYCIELQHADCERLRPPAVAIGQEALLPWAQGRVWDLTFERAPCAVPLDMTLPLDSNLNLDYLERRLAGYPDQNLIANILEGIRFEADVELQTVLVPHLISLPKGFISVRKELYRLQKLDWYRFFEHLPFWPMYVNGQGAVTRKMEDRYRRTTECGGPRRPTFDGSGLRALSINEASSIRHMPAWYRSRHDPPWIQYLHERQLDEPLQWGMPSVRPPELKPSLAAVMHDLSILLAAARQLDEPLYIFGDDAKDYFNQLAIASEDWWKLGVVFIHADDVTAPRSAGERLFFVSERRLGFGARPSSNIAQRFSEALLHLLREDMDAVEAAVPRDTRPSAVRWQEARAAISFRSSRRDSEAERSSQQRLYFAHMYTDDPILGVVGVQRALRLLTVWMRLVDDVGLIMAIAEKRHLGTWAPWLGVLLLAGMGFVLIPKAKLLRTVQRLDDLVTNGMSFQEYRSLIGLLEHLRCIYCAAASIMYGLYQPHGSLRVRHEGPSALIRPNPFQYEQLCRHRSLLLSTGGAPVTAALKRTAIGVPDTFSVKFTVSADAATDSKPPGIGGFCHGLYWYIPIAVEWLAYLHITVLELLATGLGAITLAPYLMHARRVRLQSDALATPFVLSRHRAHSPTLMIAHHALLQDDQYLAVAANAEVQHIGGDMNPYSDSVSRALWQRFQLLCRASNIQPVQIQVPQRAHDLLRRVYLVAQQAGVRVRTSPYVRPDPVLPPAMLMLGRRSTACEEADAVAHVSARLAAALRGSTVAQPTVARPTVGFKGAVSARLAAALSLAGHAAAALSAQVPAPAPAAISGRLASRLRGETDPSAQAANPSQAPASSSQVPARKPATTAAPRRRPGNTMVEPSWHARRQGGLTLVTIGKLRLMALPRPASAAPSLARDTLRAAAGEQAHRRAARFAKAGFGAAHSIDQLAELLKHAGDLADFGASYGTRRKNEAAWAHWEQFAALVGFDPLLSAEQVRDHHSEVGTLMATFLLYVYPKMKGKRGREWAAPRSAFAYVLAIIRIFREWKLVLPSAKVVQGELHGLLRAFVTVYGAHALMPQRRDPFRYSMIQTLLNLKKERLGARSYDPDSIIGQAFRGMLALGWRTGHRLAEFVAHPSGEICWVTRHDVSYIIAGVHVSDPTPAQLAALRPGDTILIAPPRSKTDQFGEIHSPFASAIAFSYDRNSAGFLIQQIECTRPVHGRSREFTPLFADENGLPYTHSVMDTLLHAALARLYGEPVASCYSWHSLRSGLATALKAAGCSDDIIQMICRWANPASLKIYALHGTSLHINWVDQAEKAVIDAVRGSSVPKVCNSEGNIALLHHFDGNVPTRARHVLDNADKEAGDTAAAPAAPPDSSPLTIANAVGRRVRVPTACWPTYTCIEHEGQGWTAHVLALHRACGKAATARSATVRFAEATDDRGLPFHDVQLDLSVLIPF